MEVNELRPTFYACAVVHFFYVKISIVVVDREEFAQFEAAVVAASACLVSEIITPFYPWLPWVSNRADQAPIRPTEAGPNCVLAMDAYKMIRG